MVRLRARRYELNAKLGFWLYVWVLTLSAILIAIKGIRKAGKGEYHAHQKQMDLAIRLILFFVLTYVAKLIFLGRENLANWSSVYITVLRIHETFIAIMLLSGGYVRFLARQFSLNSSQPSASEQAARKRHRLLGKVCISAALCGLGTATFLIYGMMARQGLV